MTMWVGFAFVCALLLGASVLYSSLRWGIGPVPTSRAVRRVLFGKLPHTCEGTIYELGAGWGSLALPIARRYPHCRVVAYEISFLPYLVLSARKILNRQKNLEVHWANFYEKPLDDAQLVVCYLFPRGMRVLQTKFEAELPSESVVITHTFGVPEWEPFSCVYADDVYQTPVYVYRVD